MTPFLVGLALGLWVREAVYRILRVYARAHRVAEVVADPTLTPPERAVAAPPQASIDTIKEKLRQMPQFARLGEEQIEAAARQIQGRG